MTSGPVGIAPPERLGRTRLPDGRMLAWAEWGPADGLPVLLCPGGATSRWLGFGADAVDALGVRLVSVDRPGLGASDPAPGRTLHDWPDDVRSLAAARGLDGLRVVGYSQGAPFALACAARGVVTGASIVSGSGEPAAPELADALAPGVRSMVEAVAADPSAAEAAFAASADADAMWALVTTGCAEPDRAVFRQPVFAAAYRRAITEGFARGPAGYARDTVLTMGRWPFDTTAITTPVDLWYGEQDTSVFHSPGLSTALADALPTARRHVVAEAGGMLLWTHAEPILRSLVT
ncbi:alpha/beta fold hydrolase [Streptomyces syringium]|uniref:Pimeloyl-ACP methyl ester carboxylesterase n=1 Tax=Streptomyces syringium TaxID=76729 RepID=A0ABS4XY53_9ACTN|nr:alpha/beta hydrolase [Streptomyces syringium]MBP2401453.1 pimeloyl-ACP methyl ester carboxylesterase [Streptomyces syringium]